MFLHNIISNIHVRSANGALFFVRSHSGDSPFEHGGNRVWPNGEVDSKSVRHTKTDFPRRPCEPASATRDGVGPHCFNEVRKNGMARHIHKKLVSISRGHGKRSCGTSKSNIHCKIAGESVVPDVSRSSF